MTMNLSCAIVSTAHSALSRGKLHARLPENHHFLLSQLIDYLKRITLFIMNANTVVLSADVEVTTV